jgi:hypothetical protein
MRRASPTPQELQLTSAAAAAFAFASPSDVVCVLPPRVRGGPPTTRFDAGIEDVVWDGGGAEPRGRPGWEKGSEEEDSLPQSAPMLGKNVDIICERYGDQKETSVVYVLHECIIAGRCVDVLMSHVDTKIALM